MDVSVFLARAVSLYLIIVSLLYFFRMEYLKEAIKDFAYQKGLMVLGAVMSLIVGVLIVAGHNIWVLDWRVIITLLGYLSLVKGISNLFFPECMLKYSEYIFAGNTPQILGAITLLVGLLLGFYGFF